MRHFKSFVLAALTFGFFLGLGFSRGLLLQEQNIRINPNLSPLIIAVDDPTFISPETVLELEKYLARKVEIKVIGDSADLAPHLSSQSPPHLILSSQVNLASYTNSELAEIGQNFLQQIHRDFLVSQSGHERKDLLPLFWGYAVFSKPTSSTFSALFTKQNPLPLHLDEHSLCNWRMKLVETHKISKDLIRNSNSSADVLSLVAHTHSDTPQLPVEGTILWQKALAIPQQTPDLVLSQKTIEIMLNKTFALKWLLQLPAASALKTFDNTAIPEFRKARWLRQLDLSKTQKDRICTAEWRS